MLENKKDKNQLEDVIEFMKGAGQEVPDAPIRPSSEVAKLRVKLIMEELKELAEAMGVGLNGQAVVTHDPNKYNIVATADGFIDLLYVVHGGIAACGLQASADMLWKEVQTSNMSKLIDGLKREDGKVEKGPSYVKANFKKVLQEKYGKDVVFELQSIQDGQNYEELAQAYNSYKVILGDNLKVEKTSVIQGPKTTEYNASVKVDIDGMIRSFAVKYTDSINTVVSDYIEGSLALCMKRAIEAQKKK